MGADVLEFVNDEVKIWNKTTDSKQWRSKL